jgi:hypothetical protein
MRRAGLLSAPWIFLIMACCGCDSRAPAAARAAPGTEESIVGSWTVKNIGPFAGSIMSFRKEGTLRILMTVPPEQLEELQQLPPDEQARQSKSLVVQNGATYFNVNGTWKQETADKIKAVITVGSGEKKYVTYTVHHFDKGNMELREGGVPPTQLRYMDSPLPPT